MQAQDRSANLDTSYLSAVMPEKSPAQMGQSVSDVDLVSFAEHLKKENRSAQLDSTPWVELQSVKTVQKAMSVQTVDHYLRLVLWDITQMSRTLSHVYNARLGLNVRQPMVILLRVRQV